MYRIERKIVGGNHCQGIVTQDGRLVGFLEKGSRLGVISSVSLEEEDDVRRFINNSRIRRGVLWIANPSVS